MHSFPWDGGTAGWVWIPPPPKACDDLGSSCSLSLTFSLCPLKIVSSLSVCTGRFSTRGGQYFARLWANSRSRHCFTHGHRQSGFHWVDRGGFSLQIHSLNCYFTDNEVVARMLANVITVNAKVNYPTSRMIYFMDYCIKFTAFILPKQLFYAMTMQNQMAKFNELCFLYLFTLEICETVMAVNSIEIAVAQFC